MPYVELLKFCHCTSLLIIQRLVCHTFVQHVRSHVHAAHGPILVIYIMTDVHSGEGQAYLYLPNPSVLPIFHQVRVLTFFEFTPKMSSPTVTWAQIADAQNVVQQLGGMCWCSLHGYERILDLRKAGTPYTECKPSQGNEAFFISL